MALNSPALTSFGYPASHLQQLHQSVGRLYTPVKVALVSNHGHAPIRTPRL